MKRALSIGVFFLVMVLASGIAMAGGVGNYSNGYRMGQLTKFSVKGMMFKSGEGQMLVGSESTPYVKTSKDSDGNVVKKTINPWYFSSTDKQMWEKLQNSVGDYVVIEYQQSHIKGLDVDTDYEVKDVYGITEPLSETCMARSYTSGSKSEGTRVGRIVKASEKGTIANSYEIMMQMGNSGNQFKNLSISEDQQLYDCAVRYLKAGQKVKIHYDESHINMNVMGRETNYDIVKLEPVKGLN